MEFPLNESCREIAEFLKQEALDHNTTFEFILEPGDLPIVADKVQIEQVLVNLIRNAIEAYNDCETTHRPVIISTQKVKECIYISVADHAKGISAEILEKLFEPFFTSKSTGLGMGLSISRTIIETHGGQLWAESDGKTGTQFHIKIPAKG